MNVFAHVFLLAGLRVVARTYMTVETCDLTRPESTLLKRDTYMQEFSSTIPFLEEN